MNWKLLIDNIFTDRVGFHEKLVDSYSLVGRRNAVDVKMAASKPF